MQLTIPKQVPVCIKSSQQPFVFSFSYVYFTTHGPNSQYQGHGKMSDYFACLDLINFKMSSALLALSPAGAVAAAGCGAGADSVTGAVSDAGAGALAGASATGVCGFAW